MSSIEFAQQKLFADRYEIIQSLGQGGTGGVFAAFDRKLGRRVALKILHSELTKRSGYSRRFAREVRAIERIVHPNVVGILESGRDSDERAFIAMELVEGPSLGTYLEASGPLPEPYFWGLVEGIAKALEAAHRLQIIHRDIKPDNVLIEGGIISPGRVLVCDFGLAKILEDASSSQLTTHEGAVMGTPAYMAPEQAQTGIVDARADVYSFGVVLYEAASGRRPFHADTALGFMMKHATALPTSLSEVVPEASPAMVELIDRCLAKDPRDRPQSMTEVLQYIPSDATEKLDLVGATKPEVRFPNLLLGAGLIACLLFGASIGYHWWLSLAPVQELTPQTSMSASMERLRKGQSTMVTQVDDTEVVSQKNGPLNNKVLDPLQTDNIDYPEKRSKRIDTLSQSKSVELNDSASPSRSETSIRESSKGPRQQATNTPKISVSRHSASSTKNRPRQGSRVMGRDNILRNTGASNPSTPKPIPPSKSVSVTSLTLPKRKSQTKELTDEPSSQANVSPRDERIPDVEDDLVRTDDASAEDTPDIDDELVSGENKQEPADGSSGSNTANIKPKREARIIGFQVEGSISQARTYALLERRLSRLQFCLQKEDGAKINAIIGFGGRIRTAKVSGPNKKIQRCLTKTLRSVRWPYPDTGDVQISFRLGRT